MMSILLMPKTDINYSKTIIYKIVCNDLNVMDCYVGHTTNFSRRKIEHKSRYHQNIKFKIYETIRAHGGWENWTMVMICECNCKNKLEACKVEREWYEKLNANLNELNPYVNIKENEVQYYSNYYKENKQKNKLKIQEYQNTKCNCKCGGKYTLANKARHMRSKTHLTSLELLSK